MGTRSLLVFRVKGKIVLQVHTQGDGYPSGNPAIVANLLLDLLSEDGEIVADLVVTQIADALKDCVGNIYSQTLYNEFDALANWPFMEYVYIFDFTDCIKVTCQTGGGKYHKDMDLAAFARFCELEKLPDDYVEPKLITAMDWNDPKEFVVEDFEYVSMLDESGAPYFHFKVNGGWHEIMREKVLGISLCNGLGGRCEIGDVANGSDCLAMQILKLTYNEFKKVVLLPEAPDVDSSDFTSRYSRIAFYDCKHDIAAHDLALMEESKSPFAPRTDVHGIYSLFGSEATVHKAKFRPPMPQLAGKRKRSDDDSDEKIVNKKITVTRFTAGEADEDVRIAKGQSGMHLFTTNYGAKFFLFEEGPYQGEYVLSHGQNNLKFSYDETGTTGA